MRDHEQRHVGILTSISSQNYKRPDGAVAKRFPKYKGMDSNPIKAMFCDVVFLLREVNVRNRYLEIDLEPLIFVQFL